MRASLFLKITPLTLKIRFLKAFSRKIMTKSSKKSSKKNSKKCRKKIL